MILFHWLPLRLGDGSVILPGNYGRMLRRGGWDHPHAMREVLLEAVRVRDFPDRPSRQNCVFCCLTVDDALLFRAEFDGFAHHILHCVRVEAGQADAPVEVFLTNPLWINPAVCGAPPLSGAWAVRYWQGFAHGGAGIGQPIQQRREVLVGGSVIVEDIVDLAL